HLDRASGAIHHSRIAALPDLLHAGDLVVVNDTRVFPARLIGRRVPSGGAVEWLLVGRLPEAGQPSGRHGTGPCPAAPPGSWEALVPPGRNLRPGAGGVLEGAHTIHGEIPERRFFGRRVARLWTDDGSSVDEAVDAIGHMPLPPYIKRDDRPADRDRYQTVFA